jgi:hypothetical protein
MRSPSALLATARPIADNPPRAILAHRNAYQSGRLFLQTKGKIFISIRWIHYHLDTTNFVAPIIDLPSRNRSM